MWQTWRTQWRVTFSGIYSCSFTRKPSVCWSRLILLDFICYWHMSLFICLTSVVVTWWTVYYSLCCEFVRFVSRYMHRLFPQLRGQQAGLLSIFLQISLTLRVPASNHSVWQNHQYSIMTSSFTLIVSVGFGLAKLLYRYVLVPAFDDLTTDYSWNSFYDLM